MRKLAIEWKKIETDGKIKKFVQNQIFNNVTFYMEKMTGVPKMPKNDHYSIIVKTGTILEIEVERDKINNIEVNKVNNMLAGIRRTRVYRFLPKTVKQKFAKIDYSPNKTAWEQLTEKLVLLGVQLYLKEYD